MLQTLSAEMLPRVHVDICVLCKCSFHTPVPCHLPVHISAVQFSAVYCRYISSLHSGNCTKRVPPVGSGVVRKNKPAPFPGRML